MATATPAFLYECFVCGLILLSVLILLSALALLSVLALLFFLVLAFSCWAFPLALLASFSLPAFNLSATSLKSTLVISKTPSS